MMTRSFGLALIALVMVLAGCRVTFHGPIRLAPGSLVGYSLMLTNSVRSGPWASAQETYHFKSKLEAFNSRLDRARSWSYDRDDHDTATVSIIYLLTNFNDAIITCALTFESHRSGTHDCKYEESASTMFGEAVTQVGSSSGTFRMTEIGQSGI